MYLQLEEVMRRNEIRLIQKALSYYQVKFGQFYS